MCFLCERALDNWEDDDCPLDEHLKHSPQCGWAVLKELDQERFDPTTMEDPTQTRLAEARRATFMDLWPHESKRGWLCKTPAMVVAGWHFAPTIESDDFVSCAYCKLSLDGWEPKDNPFDEHHRRSPDCPFFSFAGTTAPKATKGKKSRSSKASRLSTQSTMTSTSEAPSIPDLDESIDASTLSVNTVASRVSAISNKKGSRSKGRSTRTSKVEVESIEVEPPVIQEESRHADRKAPRGRKRTSDQISDDGRAERESTVKPEHSPKRRNTRTRSSVMEQVNYPVLQPEPEAMAVESAQLKPKKGGKKRASSRSRKTSAASTASMRAAIPDNAAIDAELEAELDRPMSDEDQPIVVEELPKKRGRKPKATAASIASTRGPKLTHIEQDTAKPGFEVQAAEDSDLHLTYSTDMEDLAPARSKSTKTKAPRKNATMPQTRTNRGSAGSIASATTGLEPQLESSMITSQTEADDSGHETDASVGGKSVVRKGSKRKATTKGRGKKGGTSVLSKNIEDVVQSQSQHETVLPSGEVAQTEIERAAVNEIAEQRVERPVALPAARVDIPTQDEEAPKKPARTGKKPEKAKSTTTKKARAGDRPPQLSMPGAFSPLMPDQDQDVEPSFASVLSPSSPPVVALARDNVLDGASLHVTSPRMPAIPPQLPPRSPLRDTIGNTRPTPTPQLNNVQRGQKETTPSPSPQSSDAENAPPSTRPPSTRPPLAPLSPSKNQMTRVPLAPGTPRAVPLSPSKIGGGLKSDIPWMSVDVEMVFASTSPGVEKENVDVFGALGVQKDGLTSPEKKMTVEEWINWSAQKAEEGLRAESERVVGIFEREGGRALRVLEGVEVSD